MPPHIAEALLRGTPRDELCASFESASIGFIALSGFDARMATLPPAGQIEVRRGDCRGLAGHRNARCRIPSPSFSPVSRHGLHCARCARRPLRRHRDQGRDGARRRAAAGIKASALMGVQRVSIAFPTHHRSPTRTSSPQASLPRPPEKEAQATRGAPPPRMRTRSPASASTRSRPCASTCPRESAR